MLNIYDIEFDAKVEKKGEKNEGKKNEYKNGKENVRRSLCSLKSIFDQCIRLKVKRFSLWQIMRFPNVVFQTFIFFFYLCWQ